MNVCVIALREGASEVLPDLRFTRQSFTTVLILAPPPLHEDLIVLLVVPRSWGLLSVQVKCLIFSMDMLKAVYSTSFFFGLGAPSKK